MSTARQIDRARLAELITGERVRFADHHPRSQKLWEGAQLHMLDGVPMNWMTRWASPYPVFVAAAHGARFTDVDGIEHTSVSASATQGR